jgi:L-rhamnose mutarotase
MKHCIAWTTLAFLAVSCAPSHVQRHAWITGLKPQKADYYRKLHANPWPEVTATLKRCHIRNFSIYEREIAGKIYLFAYLEYTGSDFDTDIKNMGECPHTQRWWRETDPCQEPLPEAIRAGKVWATSKEIYHLP